MAKRKTELEMLLDDGNVIVIQKQRGLNQYVAWIFEISPANSGRLCRYGCTIRAALDELEKSQE